MRKKLSKILVTGGAGFIGSAFARLCVKKGLKVVVVDSLTYAGDLNRLVEINKKIAFYKADITNKKQIERIFLKESPEIVVNFAAETHVDRSIKSADSFIVTNIMGTQVLLDISKQHSIARFIHISTDEVYGDIKQGSFFEATPLNPSSPYSASKAAADLLIRSYLRTHSFPAIIIRPSNNYGPWQYPEKFIPLSILKVLRGEKIPLYGKGQNVREWLYVEDSAEAILRIIDKGKIGEVYNLGSNEEKKNIEVVKMILNTLGAPGDMFNFVKDRPGHDIRYRLNSQKLFRDTGWRPHVKFEDGLKSTIQWCIANKSWLLSKWKNVSKLYKK